MSALLGLAVAVPPSVVVDDGLIGGYGGYGNGYGLGLAGPIGLGHGISSSYSSRIAHPSVLSVHGGLVGGPVVRSYAAPALVKSYSAPIVSSYAAPIVRSYAGPSVYSGHGIVGPSVVSGYGLGSGLGYGAGLGYGLGYGGKGVW